MKKLKRFFTKKTVVTVLGVAACLASGGVLPPETANITLIVVGAIVSMFNLGQGIADGVSHGATSVHRPDDPE